MGAGIVGSVLGLAAAVIAAVPAGAAQNNSTPEHNGEYSALIQRTEYGIPHILAADYGDLGFGYGYAFAQDNLCTLADEILTVDGARSQYLGPDGNSGDQLSAPVSNLDSDVYYRQISTSGVVEQAVRQPAPLGPTQDARRLVAGYVAGVNHYLADTGVANLPDPTCRAKPWVHPITVDELNRLMYSLNLLEGTGSFKSLIAEAAPGAAGQLRPNLEQPGSNAIAIGSAGTQNGHGELLANPHFPWLGGDRFYQVQLTIPGRLNVSGASIYGSPTVEIGHTTHLAWSHTVSTAERFTLYQLKLVPGDPTSYLVDGHAEAMTKQTITVPVRTSAGGQGTVSRTLYSSRYGPVLGLDWTASSALAVRDANYGNVRAISEWLAMDGTDSVARLRAVQNHFQGLPFVNTIASDSGGHADIADASVVPDVTDAEATRCIDTPLAHSFQPNIFVLDGSTSSCGWGTDPTAIAPGQFGPATDPTLARADYVTNSNDSLWLSNPAAPLSFPRIYGQIGSERSGRTRLGLEQIGQRLAGTDGLGSAGFTVPTLQGLLLSDRILSAELTRDATVSLCRAHPVLTASNGAQVDVRAACAVLANWNLRADPDSRGEVLWRTFWLGASRAPDLWLVPFDPNHPATTPNTLNTGSATVSTALANAVQSMRAAGMPLDAPLSAAQVTTVGGPSVAVPGCTNQEGCFNIVANQFAVAPGKDGTFPPVIFGSSFIMAIDLGQNGPTARTLLTYSESANPASPHHGDQTALFSHKQWVTDRFTEAQIATDPHLQVTLITSR